MSKPVSGGGASDMRGTSLVRHLQSQVANQQGGAQLDGSSTQKKANVQGPKRTAARDIAEPDQDDKVANATGKDRYEAGQLDH